MSKNVINSEYFKIKMIKVESISPKINSFKLQKGNNPYELQFLSKNEQELIESNLLDYNLIDSYEAIYSKNCIEAQLSLSYEDYKFFCYKLDKYSPFTGENGEKIEVDPPKLIDIPNTWNNSINIGLCSASFSQFLVTKGLYKNNISPITIVISNINISDYEDAKSKLQKYALSALFSISTELHIPITLRRDVPARGLSKDKWLIYDDDLALQADDQLNKLNNYYESKTTLFYLNANRSFDLPVYQFLQYYHCLEYYFPVYQGSRFKSSIISEINNITNETETLLEKLFNKCRGFSNEIECLKDVLTTCIKNDELSKYIISRKKLKSYFIDSNKHRKLSEKEIKNNSDISLEKVALRVYDIRNSIVHSKYGENKFIENQDNIESLKKEIILLKFIVEKVIIFNKC